MVSESEEEENHSATSPRSRREQIQEVMESYKEKLMNIKGQVFHMMDNQNQMFRLRIGTDGRIALSPRILSIPSSVNLASIVSVPKRVIEAGIEAPKRVLEAGIEARDQMKVKAKRRWRKAVTGDPDKRIRDHMKEVPQVKMIDKLSFTFGVLCIAGSEWLSLRHADWFPLYYSVIMTCLLLWRLITYTRDKYQLFMLDLCYFVNLSVFLQTTFFLDNVSWFKANYILCMGPLMCAIIVWKNSLVFHSLDKLTSFFLHAFPPIVVHLLRWGMISSPYHYPETDLSFYDAFSLPIGLYITWQIGYWVVTEIFLRRQLAADKDLITSVRWLSMDKKNGFRNLSVKLLKSGGLMSPGEDLDPDSVKTKIVFAVSQLVYTLLTVLPTPFLYGSYRLSCAYLVFIFGWGTWNGASYYIEVFAERYSLQFVAISESEKDDGSVLMADDEDEDEDSDVYENALEELEIDDSHELYQTIVAAIIEESDQHAKEVFEEEKNFNIKKESNENSLESSDSNGIGWEDLGSE